MRTVWLQLSALLKWTCVHESSRPGCPCVYVWSRNGRGRVCLLYPGCQIAPCIPSRRRTGPCSMLMNIHPLNGLCVALSPSSSHAFHPFPPSPCSLLSCTWHIRKKKRRVSAPFSHRGTVLFNRWKNSSRVSIKTLLPKCQREMRKKIP